MPGRNELCPCGSGKKFKRCCLTGNQAETVTNVISANKTPCLLCAKEPYVSADFIPDGEMAKEMKVPEGKQRHILYTLCETCFSLPNKTELIEAKILREYQDSPLFTLGKAV